MVQGAWSRGSVHCPGVCMVWGGAWSGGCMVRGLVHGPGGDSKKNHIILGVMSIFETVYGS